MESLFTPVTVGRMKLDHRLAMAPMTRDRALPDGTPSALMPLYYAQRASLGLLITEGTQPSEDGQGYLLTPGVHTEAHVAGWRAVADAVHERGGHLYIQLMHVGRMSHPDNTPHHRQPVAPSAIAPGEQMFTATGMRDIPVPRALSTDEVRATVDDFRRAAALAVAAGADGVEIHGANGYLVHQFFAENANHRTDEYGGSVENRARFGVEVAAAVAAEIGADRVGFRISPGSPAGGLDEGDSGPRLYRRLVAELARLGLAYLHVLHLGDEELLREVRAAWPTALLVNRPGQPREALAADVDAGLADVVAVGARALANPDLVERLRTGAPLNEPDPATYYGGDARGYTDYPALG
ncbi:alkene reductase [Streptomyces sp. Ru71]|uniref:alkene reductase n=1 Tax=Streptomyces sp. Ru71 TaxID=2080746 RepID=UPI000CDE0D9E|nr:alkene reductase [Streptomyces sp. Ru71]POX50276.1 alkene reductase [Streptomyces sp. Ru71]